MPYVDESKCIGCGICANICPDGIEMVNWKARIKNGEAGCLKDAADACPVNAILLDKGFSGKSETSDHPPGFGQEISSGQGEGRGLGMGFGSGRGMGQGKGRGLGMGFGSGRGMGQGRGRNRRW